MWACKCRISGSGVMVVALLGRRRCSGPPGCWTTTAWTPGRCPVPGQVRCGRSPLRRRQRRQAGCCMVGPN
uniref:Uncharacterized protein n=1 Tax=Arundo donax TaxID=35708 RepID=A0A0A9C6S2_ARUDO